MPSIVAGISRHNWHWPLTLGTAQVSQNGGSNRRRPSIQLGHNTLPSLRHPTQWRGNNRSSAEWAKFWTAVCREEALILDIFP